MEPPEDRNQTSKLNEQDGTTTQVHTCQWQDSLGLRFCQQQLEDHSPFCILHDTDPDKDGDGEFSRALEDKIRADEESDEGWINLSGVVFPRDANFRARAFNKALSFREAKVNGCADFSEAQFNKGADFQRALFGEGASFYKAHFMGQFNSDFLLANFRGYTSFDEAHFDHMVTLSAAQFHAEASFRGTQFSSRVSFGSNQFSRGVSFEYSKFSGVVHFDDVWFGETSDFTQTQFSNAVHFRKIIVAEALNFKGATFSNSNPREKVSFTDIKEEYAGRIRFDGVDLSRVSFLRTDVSQTRFVGCKWAEVSTLPFPLWICRSFGQFRHVIFDELLLQQRKHQGESVHDQLATVAHLYRQLQINYEANRQEAEAGDFYVGFMEMRRNDPDNFPWFYRVMLFIYRELSKYGEAFGRPLFWYLVVLSPLFALGYWRLSPSSYGDALFSALTAGFFFREVPQGIEGWEKLLFYANMVLVILFLGLTIIALRRHFRR